LAALIDIQSDRLAALVTNVLDMSRVQAGVLKPRASVSSVADLVSNVLAELPQDSPARRADIHIPGNLPPVDIDTVLIGRVLTNLLDNASRHAPPDTPIIICGWRSGPGLITVSVTDHGPGIAVNRREEIFGLFLRREADTGLDAHGQRIWVDNVPGGGASFCFTLPIATDLSEEH
jgi:two-component system sensor histidine kinase KdpD